MPDRTDGISSTPPPPNAFHPLFLRRFDERDEPLTSPEADMAGPWSVEPVPGQGFGLFRAGESPARGFRPVAVFPDRFLALLTAAALPGSGRDPLLTLAREPAANGDGYAVLLAEGKTVGHLAQFDDALLDDLNALAGLARTPASLAFVLEAAGAVTLEHCGAILDERIPAAAAGAGS